MLFFFILIIAFAGSFFLPWWVAAIIAFVAAFFIGKTSGSAFWSGFFALALVWLVVALLKTVPNDHILAARVAILFTLPGWGYLLAITCLIGGLVGGMSSLSGLLVKKVFEK
jgi:hypothetical protein